MREIKPEYLNTANDLLKRIEGCILDEVVISWRHIVMKFVWDKQEVAENPGDIAIEINVGFNIKLNGSECHFKIDDLQEQENAIGAVLRTIKKRIGKADIDPHRLQIVFENLWSLSIPLYSDDFEPVVIWDMRKEGGCLPI